MRRSRSRAFVAMLASAAVLTGAESVSTAPSFDCERAAAGGSEALICETPELAALDRELAAWYAEALATVPAEEIDTLRARQRGWIKGRNESWKANDPVDYLRSAYRTRIVELGIQAGRYRAPMPAQFDCSAPDLERLIVLAYDTDPPAAVFTMIPDHGRWIATGTATADRRHYNTGGLDFEETASGAVLTFAGKVTSCTRRTVAAPRS